MALGITVIGAGIFAREEHVPAIKACKILELKAIYSRSESSSTALASSAGVDAYFESSSQPSKSLDHLLQRTDIQAVVIAVPITHQPDFIKRALSAGKHVLSEKPIAKDVVTAQELIHWKHENAQNRIWSVAENFRFLEPIQYGAEEVKKIGGNVTTFSLKLYGFIDESDKFFQTPWRQVPDYQGGFLLDGGVHFVAGLRHLLAAAGGQDITHLAAFTSLLQKKLAPVDTVHGTMRISNGNNGTFSVSFGAEFKSGFEIEIITDKGAVAVRPTEVVTTVKDEKGEKKETKEPFEFSAGVKLEIISFAQSIEAGKEDERSTPEQALADLTVLESLLRSGEQDGKVQILI